VILIVINNITPKEEVRGFPKNVKKGAKDYIGNYYGPSNKRHQISFFHISGESYSVDTSLEDVLECDFGIYLM